MSRLTKKIENPQYSNDYEMLCTFDYHLINKLGKLEDLEEQLGCPLEVVFKALKDGIIIKDLPKGYEHRKVILNYLVNDNSFIFRPSAPYCSCKLYLKDYKKTWWISKTKEE